MSRLDRTRQADRAAAATRPFDEPGRQPRVFRSLKILDLHLDPIHLNLLGLTVDTSAICLKITAQSGPGNLLGNLLCAVAGLLDGTSGLNGILNQLVGVLNQLLGVLG